MDADMAGTWTLTSGIIEFDQTADTFVRDVPFRPSKNRLVVDLTSSQGRLIVVLTK
jgi:hypothetical protein